MTKWDRRDNKKRKQRDFNPDNRRSVQLIQKLSLLIKKPKQHRKKYR